MRDPLISLKEASFGYSSETILNRISLDVFEGDFIGLVGPNGSGKTTLFRGLLGLLKPLQGEVRLEPSLRGRIGYVPQRDQLDSIFPVTSHDVVRMGLIGHRTWYAYEPSTDTALIRAALQKVGMENGAGSSFFELSGGQRQRILIARALVIDPRLLVLDEPTAGVDPGAEDAILELLTRLNQEENRTILMVSHRVHSLSHHARRAVLVKDRGIRLGTPEDILSLHKNAPEAGVDS